MTDALLESVVGEQKSPKPEAFLRFRPMWRANASRLRPISSDAALCSLCPSADAVGAKALGNAFDASFWEESRFHTRCFHDLLTSGV